MIFVVAVTRTIVLIIINAVAIETIVITTIIHVAS